MPSDAHWSHNNLSKNTRPSRCAQAEARKRPGGESIFDPGAWRREPIIPFSESSAGPNWLLLATNKDNIGQILHEVPGSRWCWKQLMLQVLRCPAVREEQLQRHWLEQFEVGLSLFLTITDHQELVQEQVSLSASLMSSLWPIRSLITMLCILSSRRQASKDSRLHKRIGRWCACEYYPRAAWLSRTIHIVLCILTLCENVDTPQTFFDGELRVFGWWSLSLCPLSPLSEYLWPPLISLISLIIFFTSTITQLCCCAAEMQWTPDFNIFFFYLPLLL